MKDKQISNKITGKMLKGLIEECLREELPEQSPLPIKDESNTRVKTIKANSLGEIPNAWDPEEVNVVFELDEFDWRSEEEILKDQVRFKWNQFKKTLSQREQATLRSMLGLDVKRYSIDELEKLQGALKGKASK